MAQGLFDKSCSAVRNAHWGTSPTRDMRMRGKVIVLTVRHRGLVTYCRTIGCRRSGNVPTTERKKRGVAAQCGVQNDMHAKVECMRVQKRKNLH